MSSSLAVYVGHLLLLACRLVSIEGNLGMLMLWPLREVNTPLCISAISILLCPPRDRNVCFSVVSLERPHDKGWSQVSELQGRQLFAADPQRQSTKTDTHAFSRRRVKPYMQQRYIRTSFGGSLSLSPPWAMFSQSHPHSAASDRARLISNKQHTFICITVCLPARKPLFMWSSCWIILRRCY